MTIYVYWTYGDKALVRHLMPFSRSIGGTYAWKFFTNKADALAECRTDETREDEAWETEGKRRTKDGDSLDFHTGTVQEFMSELASLSSVDAEDMRFFARSLLEYLGAPADVLDAVHED